MFQDLKVHTGNRKLMGRVFVTLLFSLVLLIQSCGGDGETGEEGVYYLTKGQAIQQVKLLYPELARYTQCSRPPDEICTWEDIFIFEDSENSNQWDLVFRSGNGRIESIGLDEKVFLIADYYYFTVTKDTGDVTNKGSFEKKLLSVTSEGAQFECSGKTFWNIPVTSDCTVFK